MSAIRYSGWSPAGKCPTACAAAAWFTVASGAVSTGPRSAGRRPTPPLRGPEHRRDPDVEAPFPFGLRRPGRLRDAPSARSSPRVKNRCCGVTLPAQLHVHRGARLQVCKISWSADPSQLESRPLLVAETPVGSGRLRRFLETHDSVHALLDGLDGKSPADAAQGYPVRVTASAAAASTLAPAPGPPGPPVCLLSGLRLLDRLLAQLLRLLDGLRTSLLRLLDGLRTRLRLGSGATACLLSLVPGTTRGRRLSAQRVDRVADKAARLLVKGTGDTIRGSAMTAGSVDDGATTPAERMPRLAARPGLCASRSLRRSRRPEREPAEPSPSLGRAAAPPSPPPEHGPAAPCSATGSASTVLSGASTLPAIAENCR